MVSSCAQARRFQMREQHHIIRLQFAQRCEGVPRCPAKSECLGPSGPHSPLIADHLAEQKCACRVFQGTVGDFDGVLYPETKPKMPRHHEPHGPEVKHRRREVALAGVAGLAFLLDPGDDGAAVKFGDVKTGISTTCASNLTCSGWFVDFLPKKNARLQPLAEDPVKEPMKAIPLRYLALAILMFIASITTFVLASA